MVCLFVCFKVTVVRQLVTRKENKNCISENQTYHYHLNSTSTIIIEFLVSKATCEHEQNRHKKDVLKKKTKQKKTVPNPLTLSSNSHKDIAVINLLTVTGNMSKREGQVVAFSFFY